MVHRRIQILAALWGVALLAVASTGCTSQYPELEQFVQAHDHGDVGISTYRIEAPDVVHISSPTSVEVDGTTKAVGLDGKISMKLIGDVKLSRLTPREAALKIEDCLSKYYHNPKVHVEVVQHHSKKIYLHGQVRGNGSLPYTGRDTVLDVVSRAQLSDLAWGAQVHIIRPNADPAKRADLIVNVDHMMETGDLRENVLLEPGDIVYVPPTPLAWVGLRCRELLYPVSPMIQAYEAPGQFLDAEQSYDRHFNNDEYRR